MSELYYGGLVFYYLCWLAVPALGVVILAAQLDGHIRIPWLRAAQTCAMLIGLTFTGYSQSNHAWGQQQKLDDRLREVEKKQAGQEERNKYLDERLATALNSIEARIATYEVMHRDLDEKIKSNTRAILSNSKAISEGQQTFDRIELYMQIGLGLIFLLGRGAHFIWGLIAAGWRLVKNGQGAQKS